MGKSYRKLDYLGLAVDELRVNKYMLFKTHFNELLTCLLRNISPP